MISTEINTFLFSFPETYDIISQNSGDDDMIFILVAFGGSYEDAWRANVAASTDKSKIEELKILKEERREKIKVCKDQITKFCNQWDEANPFDQTSLEKTVDVPKWPSGINQKLITKEMRIERDTIRKFNDGVLQRNAAKQAEHRNRRVTAEKEYAREIGLFDIIPEEKLTGSYYSLSYELYSRCETNYEIDEVKEI